MGKVGGEGLGGGGVVEGLAGGEEVVEGLAGEEMVEGLAGEEEVVDVDVDMVARRVRRAGMERARRAVVGREGRRRGIIWWILG